MWIVARFLPTTLFSLRPALSTASGAQTLLIPTPFAIKMALLNAVIQVSGVTEGSLFWPVVRDLDVALSGPDCVVVNKTFIKIQRPTRFNRKDEEEVAAVKSEMLYPFNPTIAFREFVQYGGAVAIAVKSANTEHNLMIAKLFQHINYFGKRGSFWQLQELPGEQSELDPTWTILTRPQTVLSANGTLQILDDCGPKLSWDHVNIYSGKSIKISQDERILRPIVLPYEHARSSYRYSLYQRLEEATL